MAGDQLLFLKLAEALGQPSKAYRAAQEGISIFDKGLSGYEAGTDLHEKLRKRKVAQQSLRDVLGENVPDRFSKVADLPGEQVAQFGGLRHLSEVSESGLTDLEKEAFRDARHQRGLAEAMKRHKMTLAMQGKRLGAQQEAKEEKSKGQARVELERSKSIVNTIDNALKQVGPLTTGIPGAVLRNVPQTSAKNLNDTLLTVKANVGFEELQRMRQNSPTGGALGNVSDTENRNLQATRGSLDQAQTDDQLVANLTKMKKHYSNIILAIEGQTGDPEADDAIAQVISSDISEPEKRARIQGIRAAAGAL